MIHGICLSDGTVITLHEAIQRLPEVIADAVAAERERAARVAEEYAAKMEASTKGMTEWEEGDGPIERSIKSDAGCEIAAEIRKG